MQMLQLNVSVLSVFQSLDPLPMRGPELGVQADDIESPEIEQPPKQEVLENKDVRLVWWMNQSATILHVNNSLATLSYRLMLASCFSFAT